MIELHKPVYRISRAQYAVLRVRKFRQVVIGLEPVDLLSFREKGRRQKWTLAVEDAFLIAVKRQVAKDRQAVIDAKKKGAA